MGILSISMHIALSAHLGVGSEFGVIFIRSLGDNPVGLLPVEASTTR
jgi:hypothetical protein